MVLISIKSKRKGYWYEKIRKIMFKISNIYDIYDIYEVLKLHNLYKIYKSHKSHLIFRKETWKFSKMKKEKRKN